MVFLKRHGLNTKKIDGNPAGEPVKKQRPRLEEEPKEPLKPKGEKRI